MENKQKIGAGILGLLTILAAFGGGTYLTQDQFENAYVCLATEQVGIFYGGVSTSSGLTAYPYAENRSDFERCYASNGDWSSWIPLENYLEEFNKTVNDILKPKNITVTPNTGKKYECLPNDGGCVEIG